MSERKLMAGARVQITVEFQLGDVWGSDCSVAQVYKQAREAALNSMRCGLVIEELTNNSASKTVATIVGEPKVTAILVETQR